MLEILSWGEIEMSLVTQFKISVSFRSIAGIRSWTSHVSALEGIVMMVELIISLPGSALRLVVHRPAMAKGSSFGR